MGLRTQLFSLIPWVGGMNTSVDQSQIDPNQLTEADNVMFAEAGSRHIRDGIAQNWDTAISGSEQVVAIHDYWYGSTSRTQKMVAVTNGKKIFGYSGGIQTSNLFTGSAWTDAVTTGSMITLNNLCIIAVDGLTNVMKKFDGTSVQDLGVSSATGDTVAETVITTGNISSTSGVISSIPALASIKVGATITGAGIQTGSVVLSIVGAVINMNFPATATTTGVTLSFGNPNPDTITNVGVTGTSMVVGATITGIGIPANTTILTIVGNTITISNPATVTATGATLTFTVTPPAASILREHLERLWTNDKTNLDRLQFSSTGNPEEWGGLGDSGAVDIGVGDGDPGGITAIFPSFKGVLFVAKRTKLYKISGFTPEDFEIELISSGVGCVSHNSVASIDQDDMYYVSERGIHSVSTTQQYGDFIGSYLSKDIQKTFNDTFTKNRLKYCWGAYLAEKNIYAIAVTDSSLSATENLAIWAYNIPQQAWHRQFKGLPCASLAVVRDPDAVRFYIGSNVSRIFKSFTGVKYDVSTAGALVAIPMRVKTGMLYMDKNAYTMKAYRKFALFYRAEGSHTITVTLKIDNYPPQTLAFTNTSSSDLLGTTFILGTSTLGGDAVSAPYTFPISGYGRGIQVTIEQNGVLSEADVDIQGFGIEWEPADTRQQVAAASTET